MSTEMLSLVLLLFLAFPATAPCGWFGRGTPARAKAIVSPPVKDLLLLKRADGAPRCRRVALDLEKDQVSERRKTRYSSRSLRSGVILMDWVVMGDRDGREAALYSLKKLREAGRRELLPDRFAPLAGSRQLKRWRFEGKDYLVTADLAVHELDGAGEFHRTSFGPPCPIRWEDLKFHPERPDLALALTRRELFLVDMKLGGKTRRMPLEATGRRLAVTKDHLILTEETEGGQGIRFSLWSMPARTADSIGRPELVSRSETMSGWCYHLAALGDVVVAGVETRRDRRNESRFLVMRPGTSALKVLSDSLAPGVRFMVPDGRYLHVNGATFLLRGNELEKVRTWERVGQPDGFPYFGDRAGSILVVPGNPEPSALVFLNDLLFEEWR